MKLKDNMLFKRFATLNHLLILIIIVFILSRLVIIESDLPTFAITLYSDIEELHYSIPAMDFIENGKYIYQNKYSDLPDSLFIGSSHFLNLIVIFFIKLFGDNYYGSRMASVLCGLIIVILTLKFTKTSTNFYFQNNTKKLILMYFLSAYFLIFDFSFILSNIVIEPTIFRATSVFILIYIFHIINKTKINVYKKNFVLGLISCLFFVFVYPTNFFIFIGHYLWVAVENKNDLKKIVTNISISILGNIIGILIIFGFLYLKNINIIYEIEYLFNNYSTRVSLNKTGLINKIKTILINAKHISSANFLRYNFINLLLFFPVMLFSMYRTINKTAHSMFYITCCFIIAFLIQTLFINDYPQRKLIILFPFFVILLLDNLMYLQKYFIGFKKISFFNKLSFIILAVFWGFVVIYSQFKLKFISSNCDGEEFYKPFFFIFSIFPFLIYLIIKKRFNNFFFFILLFSSTTFYSFSYIYKKISYNYKNALIELNQLPKNSMIVGGRSLGFRLYNNNNFAVNSYMYYNKDKLLIKNIKNISKNYKNVFIILNTKDTLYFNTLNLKLINQLLIDKCQNNISLYKIINKDLEIKYF